MERIGTTYAGGISQTNLAEFERSELVACPPSILGVGLDFMVGDPDGEQSELALIIPNHLEQFEPRIVERGSSRAIPPTQRLAKAGLSPPDELRQKIQAGLPVRTRFLLIKIPSKARKHHDFAVTGEYAMKSRDQTRPFTLPWQGGIEHIELGLVRPSIDQCHCYPNYPLTALPTEFIVRLTSSSSP